MVVSWKRGWEGTRPEPGLGVEGVDEGGVLEGAQQLLHLGLNLLVAVVHDPTHHHLGLHQMRISTERLSERHEIC